MSEDDDSTESDISDSDAEDDDESEEEDDVEDKARAKMRAELEKNIVEAEDALKKNLQEQVQVSLGFVKVNEGSTMISANVKAVANETESPVMADYLGDMWKEMRSFSSPFYQEHLMERRVLLERSEEGLRKHVEVEKLKLKRQKLAWEKEDAEEDVEDDEEDPAHDPNKLAEDKKKVAKLSKKEQQVEKQEKKAEKDEDEAWKLPWMKGKSQKQRELPPPPKAPEGGSDNHVKPEWMKAIEDPDKQEDMPNVGGEAQEHIEKTAKQDVDNLEGMAKGKAPKVVPEVPGRVEDNMEEDVDNVEDVAKGKLPDLEEDDDSDDGDQEDYGKFPWMKNKKNKKREIKKQALPKPEPDIVKPDWLKTVEVSEEEEEEEEPVAPRKGKSSRGKHKPMFTKKTMPSVSPTVHCIILLSWQFIIVYSLLAALRTINQISKNRFNQCVRLQELVAMVCPYVMFAPMLSVLFLATRMRAIQLAQGDTERHNLPQPYVQLAMYVATYGVLFQAACKLLLFVLRYRLQDGVVVPMVVVSRSPVDIMFSVAKYVLIICIYGGLMTVCFGAIFMPAPKELWADNPPPVSATLACTLMLATTFFAIYLGLCLFRTIEELRPRVTHDINVFVKVQLLFWRARHSVNLAPMLCILFIVARMRALQMDPKRGNPPSWAQQAMYVCTIAMVFQVAAYILLPLIDRRAYIAPGPVQGQTVLVMSNPSLQVVSQVVRYIPLFCVYGGACVVVLSIYIMAAPKGEQTPPISAATSCIINLTTMYFAVYTALYIAQTGMECFRDNAGAKRLVTVFDAGQRTVMFAPMLCVLFIAARMRALQLTRTVNGKVPPGAGPQPWVQQAMYLATGAVFWQVLMAYITTTILGPGFTSDAEKEQRDDAHAPGSLNNDELQLTDHLEPLDKRSLSPSWAVAVALDIFKYLCLLAMYGGAVTVMVGIVVMTPETLPPHHAAGAFHLF